MAPRILCVAEKPAIAKTVAGHLSGGQLTTVSYMARVEWKDLSFVSAKHHWQSICEEL